nr:hypothetical protein CFP56_70194 [Quercus suber]
MIHSPFHRPNLVLRTCTSSASKPPAPVSPSFLLPFPRSDMILSFVSHDLLLRRCGGLGVLAGVELLLHVRGLRERGAAVSDWESRGAATGEVKPDGVERVGAGAAAFPERIQTDAEAAAEEPKDGDGDPAGEEGFAEDVAGAVHGHGPEDEQGEGQEDGQAARGPRCAVQLDLFVHLLVWRGAQAVGCEFGIGVRGRGEIGIVGEADGFHGDPIVGWGLEDETEDGDEDQGAQERDDIACEHGIARISG